MGNVYIRILALVCICRNSMKKCRYHSQHQLHKRTTILTVVSRSFSFIRMWQRAGKAVIKYAMPVNNIKWVNTISGLMNSLYMACDISTPKLKDNNIPRSAIVTERWAFCLITPASILRPTRKKKRTNLMFTTRMEYGHESREKIWSVASGTWPNTVRLTYWTY